MTTAQGLLTLHYLRRVQKLVNELYDALRTHDLPLRALRLRASLDRVQTEIYRNATAGRRRLVGEDSQENIAAMLRSLRQIGHYHLGSVL